MATERTDPIAGAGAAPHGKAATAAQKKKRLMGAGIGAAALVGIIWYERSHASSSSSTVAGTPALTSTTSASNPSNLQGQLGAIDSQLAALQGEWASGGGFPAPSSAPTTPGASGAAPSSPAPSSPAPSSPGSPTAPSSPSSPAPAPSSLAPSSTTTGAGDGPASPTEAYSIPSGGGVASGYVSPSGAETISYHSPADTFSQTFTPQSHFDPAAARAGQYFFNAGTASSPNYESYVPGKSHLARGTRLFKRS